MWYAAQEHVCAWNLYKWRDASESPRENSQTVRVSVLEIGFYKNSGPIYSPD